MDNHVEINTIEKIVSGEINSKARKEILQGFDTEKSHDNWRALALGLLENQALREAFSSPVTKEGIKSQSKRAWLLVGLSAAMLLIGMVLSSLLSSQVGTDKTLAQLDSLSTQRNLTGSQTKQLEKSTSYVATLLNTGDQIIIPISHFKFKTATQQY